MSDVIDANIAVHSALAETYNTDEPHFRPENKAKVSKRLAELQAMTGGDRLLDLGCGTGFIIDLARPYFNEIHGIDITPAMLSQVDADGHDITIHQGQVEQLPFDDGSFDAASAYSFLDHLEDTSKMVAEAARVLRPGGALYIDLVPNRFYWTRIGDATLHPQFELSAFARREFDMVTENDKRIEEKYGVDATTFRKAEPAKEARGVDPFAFKEVALANGFAGCDIRFDWFLGNAKVLHQQSVEDAAIIDRYLQESLPYSLDLFKYVWFVLKKEARSDD
ncbi:class I SAM-dependent methyltransferase [Oceaniradius stylonematis]|jgi:ubiquinone/menaquinone biosynthesis C-methylase UbiE|uniref:Class I SAM-dependent methyltransferase n=1 Tax=Oceaniradius stylonematis TaxID=2184161 RepID=A0A3A8ALB7_9HYPH|nr:class I SAM-dependent methyltransferase [Oceaniradius stylonematis]RKF06521.1 class I SAM-dependent methyltransferase [Oceaniradius stylonematis]